MLSDWDYFVLPKEPGLIDYQKLFGNANPVFVEIGSGKGEFISQYPLLYPKSNFLGFEVRAKRIRNILKKIEPSRHPNVRIVEEYVDHTISQRLPENSVSGVFIQHPDPWPKRRHHRRRLIQPELLDAMAVVLKPDAFVQIATDHTEYAQWIARIFVEHPLYESLSQQLISEQSHLDNHVVTWFEQEQRLQGYEPNFMFFKLLSQGETS